MGPALSTSRQRDEDEVIKEAELAAAKTFELPKEIADPTKSPCVNVPDW
jgi:hypothetical protein